MNEMNDKLFVYGSLLHNFDSAIGRFLKLHSRYLGEVYANGILYDLGHYPGLVLSTDSNQLVYGHLLQVLDPRLVFITLDRYEGLDPKDPSGSEYSRVLIQLKKNELGIAECWTYLYNLSTAGLKIIPGGNYADFVKSSPIHLRFIESV